MTRPDNTSSRLLENRLPMPASDAVAAIILVDEKSYFLQLRDNKPSIYYPGHWGLFGGAVETGEDDLTAIRRELQEELNLEPKNISYFTEFTFDMTPIGEKRIYRRFFEVRLADSDIVGLVLREGSAMGAFAPDEAFALRLTPYDSFALWMHYMKVQV